MKCPDIANRTHPTNSASSFGPVFGFSCTKMFTRYCMKHREMQRKLIPLGECHMSMV